MFQTLKNHLINLPGWRTNRNIVVFESDDWGMIRMRSKGTYRILLKKGYPVDQCVYNQNDALENNDDVEMLGNVLLSVRDKNGNPAKFTLDNVVANPDFKLIEKNKFKSYFYEPFTKTLQRFPNRDRVMNLYREGINNNIFQPQFHGREHVNVNRWLGALQNGDQRFLDAFQEQMFSVADKQRPSGRRDFLDSFGEAFEQNVESYDKIIKEGTDLFENIWGFRSDTFIAPCYIWPDYLEEVLHRNQIKGIQGTHVQRIPCEGMEYNIKRKYHYMGQTNKFGQTYLIRNAFFEPTERGGSSAVDNALKDIDRAFAYRKPAIISTHRVNYIGSIHPGNRGNNLRLLSELLHELVEKYPDVEFMSSDELIKVIKE